MVFVTFADGRRLVRGFLPEKKEQTDPEDTVKNKSVKKELPDVQKKDTQR
jgi:hypothetical protein